MSNSEFGSISFDLQNQSNVIKVGCRWRSNAINHMFKQGIMILLFVIQIHSITKQFSAK
jgi:hypothetical protein